MDREKIMEGVRLILDGIGEDCSRLLNVLPKCMKS